MSTRKAAVTQIRLLPLRLVHGWDRIKNSIFIPYWLYVTIKM